MTDVTLQTIITNINKNLPELWTFFTAMTYLAGVYFALRAVWSFKEYAEVHMAKSPYSDIRKPLINLVVASFLLYWPALFHTLMDTVFSSPSPIAWSGGTALSDEVFALCGHIIQFVGFIAFIRGVLLLARIHTQGAGQGAFAKAMTHIIGGLFAVNIFGTWAIFKATIGM